jgi:sRNA-binding carbon storage regulator CsrA
LFQWYYFGLHLLAELKGNEMQTNEYKFFKKGYLLIRRKEGQGFFIDKDTEVVIAKVDGDKVYVAVKAPNKRVVREELMSKEPRKPEASAT